MTKTQITCECGHPVSKHAHTGWGCYAEPECDCNNSEAGVYLAHIASLQAQIQQASFEKLQAIAEVGRLQAQVEAQSATIKRVEALEAVWQEYGWQIDKKRDLADELRRALAGELDQVQKG